MKIEYNFDLDKAIAAMAYLVDRLGPLDKVKLFKLLYISDRNHFVQHGRPITGDKQYALPLGPVPSNSLNAVNGLLAHPEADKVFQFLHVDNVKVLLEQKPRIDVLCLTEIGSLDKAIKDYGHMGTFELADYTHFFPEYAEVYVPGTSRSIPYELILKHHGTNKQFRYDRPVITQEIAQWALCPFVGSEPDL